MVRPQLTQRLKLNERDLRPSRRWNTLLTRFDLRRIWKAPRLGLLVLVVLVVSYYAIATTGTSPWAALGIFAGLTVLAGYQVIRLIETALLPSEAFLLSTLTGGAIVTLTAIYAGYLGLTPGLSATLLPLIVVSVASSATSMLLVNRRGSTHAGAAQYGRQERRTDILGAVLVFIAGVAIPLKEVLRFPLLIGWDPWSVAAMTRTIQLVPTLPTSIFDFVLGTGYFYFVAALANVSGLDALSLIRVAGPVSLGLLALGIYILVSKAFGIVPGLISSLLLVGSPWIIIRFTLGVRENFALVFLAGLLLVASLAIRQLAETETDHRREIVLGVMLGAVFYSVILSSSWVTHLVVVSVLLSLGLLILLFRRGFGSFRILLLSLLAIAALGLLLVLPLGIPVWESHLRTLLIAGGGAVRPGYRPLLTESAWGDFSLAIPVTIGFGLIVATRRLVLKNEATLRRIIPVLALGLGPLLILLILLPVSNNVAIFRLVLYLIVASIPFAALGWYLLARGVRKKKYLAATLAGALVIFSLISGLQVLRWAPFDGEDLASADFVKGLGGLENTVVMCPVLGHCELLKYRDVTNVLSVEGHLKLPSADTPEDLRDLALSEFENVERILLFLINKHEQLAPQSLDFMLSEIEPTYVLMNARIWILSWSEPGIKIRSLPAQLLAASPPKEPSSWGGWGSRGFS